MLRITKDIWLILKISKDESRKIVCRNIGDDGFQIKIYRNEHGKVNNYKYIDMDIDENEEIDAIDVLFPN